MTGGIPMPTASDSGKVLTVGETGKYGLATPSGGGGAFCITFNITDSTADKTFSQILAAYTDKQVIMLISAGNDGDLVYYMSHTTTDRNGDIDSISFRRVGNVSTTISVNTENTWSVI